jgi:alpha-N-arabinofuranosidase
MFRQSRTLVIASLLASTLLLTGFASATPESAAITAQVDKPDIRISPSLYGLFHDDCAYTADGGHYPEKIRNRSYLYPDIPKYWSLLRTREAKASMATILKLQTQTR